MIFTNYVYFVVILSEESKKSKYTRFWIATLVLLARNDDKNAVESRFYANTMTH
ncbi:hypothetical protein [Helicobacter fennelliae]|uniref:Uncharacterized protein n=1 Tax=Helicobacter fennelliae MRY12-0050 TaxID=1325130 RepID=T1D2K2_9HELI|nr:hypothetical protein [Helicobacter fennelliae]GAD19426.1 hypothetical protein HFN_0557 [Helicobacter fennelliae MRY12-0050]